MITVYFHQEPVHLEAPVYISDFLQQYLTESSNFALMLNQYFIAKKDYATTLLQAQDRIELIRPMQGG